MTERDVSYVLNVHMRALEVRLCPPPLPTLSCQSGYISMCKDTHTRAPLAPNPEHPPLVPLMSQITDSYSEDYYYHHFLTKQKSAEAQGGAANGGGDAALQVPLPVWDSTRETLVKQKGEVWNEMALRTRKWEEGNQVLVACRVSCTGCTSPPLLLLHCSITFLLPYPI